MKKVLVTGISGFVGTNLIRYFRNKTGIVLAGHGRSKVSSIEFLDNVNAQTLDGHEIDVVIHLAGIAHDLSNQYQPQDYYRVNFEGTQKLVDEVLKSNVSKFIFVSSIKAACDMSSTPAEEVMKANPVTDYGKSKRKAEEYIELQSWRSGKSFYILRPTMIHGPGNKGNLNLLYRFAKSGIPFPFGAFQNQRSFLSIDNFCFIVERLIANEVNSGIYHLADDGFLSTADLYKIISITLRKNPRVWNIPAGMIASLAALVGKKAMVSKLTEDMMVSNKKIVRAVGPLPVGLREGLEKTIQSFDGK